MTDTRGQASVGTESRPVSVGELTQRIKGVLEPAFQEVWIAGEISNFKHHTSGHMYFTLKDADAQIRSVMFRFQNASLKFKPQEGQKVHAFGDVSVFPRDGTYQLYVKKMTPAGRGDLYLAFERLKAKLSAEGLFDASRKKPLPFLPRQIGIVTSPTGAALQDMVRILRARDPLVDIFVMPVRVQGDGAAEQIAAAIRAFNTAKRVQLLIVGRGGGSIEDLWAFNEEVVARAIAASEIPVISAVGHETDFTIADFAADYRAATPSNAAEIAVPVLEDIRRQLTRAREEIGRLLRSRLESYELRLDRLSRCDLFRPDKRLADLQQRLDAVQDTLISRQIQIVERTQHQLELVQRRLIAVPVLFMRNRWHRLSILSVRLRSFSLAKHSARLDVLRATIMAFDPTAPLKRGYSITQLPDGTVVRSYQQVAVNQKVGIRLGEGHLECKVIRRNFL